MTATKKATPAKKNYNEAQEKFLLDNYVPKMTPEEMSFLVAGVNNLKEKGDSDKNLASVRAKLAVMRNNEGELIYQKADPREGLAGSSERKLTIVRQIEALLEFERDDLASLEKATKSQLEQLRDKLAADYTQHLEQTA